MDKGQKILFELFKTWSNEINVSEEDIALAKKEGYLFDYPKHESHSETLSRIPAILAQIDPKDVANAFLFSLSTRRLEYRSALGSYYYVKAIPEHAFLNSYNKELAAACFHCYLCGWYASDIEPREIDKVKGGFNGHNYSRYKYGMGSTLVNYALFDLEQFIKLPKVVPTEEDKQILKKILSCVDLLSSKDKAGKLRETILKAKIFKTNKDEVSVLLDHLGICGVLAGKEYPSYDVYFANEYERSPAESKNDFEYPVNHWHAGDGVNTEKLKEVFGDL